MDNSTQDSPLETVTKLAEASRAQRLSAPDEERATALLKELLAGGKAGISSALEPLVALPWIVSVNAVSAAWPNLTAPMRRLLLTGLAKNEAEQSRRLRLSLARAIFKLEPAAGLKLASSVAGELKDPENGALSSKHRQIFFNVFIGKGKPWLLQLPLGDLKGAEADQLIHCAIESFPLCPPLSQLSILRWAHAAGRFKKISEADLGIAAKSVSRWNAKLQRQLKAEIPELPEPLLAVLKPEALAPEKPRTEEPQKSQKPQAAQAPQSPARLPSPEASEAAQPPEAPASREGEAPALEAPSLPEADQPPAAAKPNPPEELVIPNRNRPDRQPPKPGQNQPRERQEERRGDRRDERPADRKDERPGREPRELREPREPRDDRARKPFDFKESLRGLESYVASLRSELEQAKAQLRRRDEEPKRGGRFSRPDRFAEERHPADVEALARHNAQLETTVQDLRQQLEDLAAHHESVAESRNLHSDQPLPEGSGEQLKALLSIKLKESYETYSAMRLEPLDRVFRLDYRDLLGTVFEVLLDQGVKLKE